MECVQSTFLSGVWRPGLTPIQQGAEDAYIVDSVGWLAQHGSPLPVLQSF